MPIYTHIVFECAYRFDLDRLNATKHSNYKQLIVLDYNNHNSFHMLVYIQHIFSDVIAIDSMITIHSDNPNRKTRSLYVIYDLFISKIFVWYLFNLIFDNNSIILIVKHRIHLKLFIITIRLSSIRHCNSVI